jgi:hypothetical protein
VQEGNYDRPFDIKQVPLSAEPITNTETKKKSALSVEEPTNKKEEKKDARQDIFARQSIQF